MTECVILFRNTQNNFVGFIGDDGEIAVFRSRAAAEGCAEHQVMCRAFPYQIVELDEL